MPNIEAVLEDGELCQFPHCTDLATRVVYNREEEIFLFYCEHHACLLRDVRDAEYGVECPNCGCIFGVN